MEDYILAGAAVIIMILGGIVLYKRIKEDFSTDGDEK